jgi:DNA-binding SARP family transcriptional activator
MEEPATRTPLKVRVLGPFDAHGPVAPVRVAGLGERALLAVLALASARPVAASVLIDTLWEEDPPRDAFNALHQRVSKLRRHLVDADAAEVLVSHGSTYQLATGGVDVDASRFTTLLATARRHGDPRRAVATYDEALALWRG